LKAFLAAVLGIALLTGVFATPLDDGKDAFGRQEWRAAAALFSRFLQESPDDAQASTAAFLRGVALYQQGDFRGSLDAFQKLDRTWPQSPFAKRLPYWKGTAALAAGQSALAERELAGQSRYPEEQPFATRALLNLGLARAAQGKDGPAVEALAAFTSANKEPELASQAFAVWGDQDKKAGRVEDALAHYRLAWLAHPGDRWDLWARTQSVDLLTAGSRYAEAQTLLEASAAAFPAEADRWDSRRVEVARGLGDRQTLGRVLEARWARESDPRKKQELAANRARTAEDAGHPEALWWQRASAGPDEALGAQAVLRYAFLLESGGRTADAAQALDDWASAHRGATASAREEVRSRAAQDRWTAGDTTGARRSWDKLIADFPQSVRLPSWLLGRGRLALEAGDSTSALADFGRLLKTFPQAPEVPEARYQTGLVYLQRAEPARAEAWFYGLVQDLKTGDLYQRALLARGISFVNSGQTDLARGSLERLIREAPEGPWTGAAWAALGRNALQSRLFEEAAGAYVKAEASLADPAEKAKALWSYAEARVGQKNAAEASAAYARYAADYPAQPRASEALYRRGAAWFAVQDWQKALDEWSPLVEGLRGDALAQTREGMATALLRLGRVQDGWDQLERLEAAFPSPEAWYRWGQAATAVGQSDWAVKAFQVLLQKHPDSSVAEAALPRAAGALLGGGKPDEALQRYADYFKKFGRQPSSAPVARSAAAAALAFPATLEALVTASKTWALAPEVAAEFALAWGQSRLDSDTDAAQAELQELSRSAPWTSQRSDALAILGRWQLSRGKLSEAKTALLAASSLGDDLSVFRARWALAQVTEKEGDTAAAARQRESAEKAAGPGVPLEFRVQILREAAATWTKAGKSEEAQRVQNRIDSLN
jgi:tetratricopeptide (TPR) repeat protein